ncbi:NUDIX hydrolase [Pikeienuella piscinae]|uniref:NUDIX hydrolase n=1 Tax=Pikeienuella piscinae TaxID=2748098 RepID=A0A7M3T618_9RHOB|nr:NUDIX hydrolase [Pikeienuella piscinae]QIE57449.1 NUDIX hydrolase [Pikeienuella piscinae]
MFRRVRLIFARAIAALGPVATRQAGALCWRHGAAGVEILLITTRRSGRWTPPKGGLMKGRTNAECAAIEAWEEAGVRGEVASAALGAYATLKSRKNGGWIKLSVEVYPLRVTEMEPRFPEHGERTLRWFPRAAAAHAVREGALRRMILGFTP